MLRLILLLAFFTCVNTVVAACDSVYIHVHFLHGSKPKRAFRHSESRWFGGRLGGHAGIEIDSNLIVDFVPAGDLHIFSHRHERHSRFTTHTRNSFLRIFGGHQDSVRFTSIAIPITPQQKAKLDSISSAYQKQTPYDYAFFGMRCGAATYDLLAQIGIVKQYSHRRTWRKIFYPRKVRRRLTRLAVSNNWKVTRQAGTSRRLWERD